MTRAQIFILALGGAEDPISSIVPPPPPLPVLVGPFEDVGEVEDEVVVEVEEDFGL